MAAPTASEEHGNESLSLLFELYGSGNVDPHGRPGYGGKSASEDTDVDENPKGMDVPSPARITWSMVPPAVSVFHSQIVRSKTVQVD